MRASALYRVLRRPEKTGLVVRLRGRAEEACRLGRLAGCGAAVIGGGVSLVVLGEMIREETCKRELAELVFMLRAEGLVLNIFVVGGSGVCWGDWSWWGWKEGMESCSFANACLARG